VSFLFPLHCSFALRIGAAQLLTFVPIQLYDRTAANGAGAAGSDAAANSDAGAGW
jgi:hypothetical protein